MSQQYDLNLNHIFFPMQIFSKKLFINRNQPSVGAALLLRGQNFEGVYHEMHKDPLTLNKSSLGQPSFPIKKKKEKRKGKLHFVSLYFVLYLTQAPIYQILTVNSVHFQSNLTLLSTCETMTINSLHFCSKSHFGSYTCVNISLLVLYF